MDNKPLTRRELLKALNISEATFYRKLKAGVLKKYTPPSQTTYILASN